MRIVFMGTAGFGVPTLRLLFEKHDIAAVVTSVDSQRGRGRKLEPSPIKIVAKELGLKILEPADLRNPEFIKKLEEYKADLFFVVAFRILPVEVFTIPPMGTVNLHASLLPDYRGAAPINWAVINGDEFTGLTTFYVDEKIDTGDMILTDTVTIGPDETAGELAGRMKETGAALSLKTVEMIEKGIAPEKKQLPVGNRPARKLYKKDGLIDWSKDALTIHNQVRGMNPVPGAYTQLSTGPLKIHRTKIMEEKSSGTPGLITMSSPKEGLVVSCGSGSLGILELQMPGKKVMDGASFVRGYRIEKGMNVFEL